MSVDSEGSTPAPDEFVNRLVSFLEVYYEAEVAELARNYPKSQQSIVIDYSDVYQFDPDVADDMVDNPDVIQAKFEEAVGMYDLPVDVDLSDATVRFGSPTGMLERITVSDLCSDHIEQFVAVRGQLSKVTGVRPRVSMAAYECQRCGVITHIPQGVTQVHEPHQCNGCERTKPFTINLAESDIVDQRKLKIEEPPEERSDTEGETIMAHVESDLCFLGGENGLPDRAGEQVVIYGILRGDDSNFRKQQNARPELNTWLDVSSIEFVEGDYSDIDVEAHRDAINTFASGAEGDPYELLKQSISTKIHITDEVDTVLDACIAWLFNSYRIDPEGYDQIRGDMHLAIIGDPATGKSSILTGLSAIAPTCEFRSGTGLSKVGLTAAAIQEEFAGNTEWTLQPGILPRANGGHCIIDEIDGVIDADTKAIHDALEGEQMVKVDKAGIKADLPTRTALLASGNPKHGRFIDEEPAASQINLDPALISRMDVILALRDIQDDDRDAKLAEHKLASYQELAGLEIAERTNQPDPAVESDTIDKPVPLEVFRAWIKLARETCFPQLSDAASNTLKTFYNDVRNLNDDPDTFSATPRTLDAGIRLSTAFARVELSDTVEEHHAERAIRLSKATLGMGFDESTGNFDIDVMETGKSSSARELDRAMDEVIQDLCASSPDSDGNADRSDVIEALYTMGFAKDKIGHRIDKRVDAGELYRPGQNQLRVVD